MRFKRSSPAPASRWASAVSSRRSTPGLKNGHPMRLASICEMRSYTRAASHASFAAYRIMSASSLRSQRARAISFGLCTRYPSQKETPAASPMGCPSTGLESSPMSSVG
eukprot:Amastigsp_a340121_174.p5 type:complete len:109 gc:universal Amastigsp_a340121_174:68-394(+)